MGVRAIIHIAERIDSERVERAVESVFSDPAYREVADPIVLDPSWIDWFRRLMDGATDFLRDVNEWFQQLRGAQPFLFWLIMAGLLVVLVALILHITYSVRMTFSALRLTPPKAAEEEKTRRKRFRDLRLEAHTQADSGEFGDAVRTLLLAIFARFEDTSPGDVQAGWTNHEVVDRIRADDVDRAQLRDLARAVDRVWYGRQPASQEEFAHAARMVDALARR